MTQDEIIEMARQAGIDVGVWEKICDDDIFGYSIGGIHENLEAFAKLVAEKKHQELYRLAEEAPVRGDARETRQNILHAIRARGEA